MKINSEKLFEFVNNLGTDEKVKFKVYLDDNYVTDINWDGENFNWEPGTFTSGMFFDPLIDFEEVKEDKKIEKLGMFDLTLEETDITEDLILTYEGVSKTFSDTRMKINELIDKVESMEVNR